MHFCLTIPELRSTIFRLITTRHRQDDEEPEETRDWPSLVNVACTCPSFFDEAADIIWEEPPRLEILLEVVQDADDEEGWSSYTEPASPTTKEVRGRLDIYVNKIRSLTIDDIHSDDLGALISSSDQGGNCLLPRLRSLKIRASRPSKNILRLFNLLLGETLQELRIETPGSFHAAILVGELFKAATKYRQNISSIHIPFRVEGYAESETPGSDLSLSKSLTTFTHVQHLSITLSNVSPALMQVIGRLPHLRHIQMDSDVPRDSTFSGRREPHFGSLAMLPIFSHPDSPLQHLRIDFIAYIPMDIRTLFTNLPISLRVLRIDAGVHPIDLWSLIDSFPRSKNLTSLSITYSKESTKSIETEMFFLSAILELLLIERIKLDVPSSMPLSDDWIGRLAVACPYLITLKITTSDTLDTSMTLACLIPISTHCRSLTQLKIALRPTPFDVNVLDMDHKPSWLRRLRLEGPRPQHPWRVMRCITMLFPRLRFAHGHSPLSDRGWTTLNHAFKEAFY